MSVERRIGKRAESKRAWDMRARHPCAGCGTLVSRAAEHCNRCAKGPVNNSRGVRGDDPYIIQRWNEGAPLMDIANELGIARGTLSSRVYRLQHDGSIQPRRDIKTKLHNEDLIRLFHQGLANSEIAELLGVSQARVTGRIARLKQLDRLPRIRRYPKKRGTRRFVLPLTYVGAMPPLRTAWTQRRRIDYRMPYDVFLDAIASGNYRLRG